MGNWDPHTTDGPVSTSPPGPQLDSNQLIAVCKNLYRECAVGLGKDTNILTAISMQQFVQWCVENDMPMKNKDAYTNKLGLRPECCKVIDELFRGDAWQCASVLAPIWFIAVLQHRPPVENAIAFVHVSFTVGFRDERVVQIAGAKEMAPGMTNTDGFLLSFMQSQSESMLQQIAHNGFDKLHANYSHLVPKEGDSLPARQEIPPPPDTKIGW